MPRVELRGLTAADREPFIAAMRASRRLHRPWISPPTSSEEFSVLLNRCRDASFEFMLACRPEDGAIVGYFDISQIVRGPLQSAYLGYGGVADHARQGYMGAALRLVLARAFGELALHRLEANIQPGNEPSLALVRRAGFVKEGFSERYLKIGGRWRDHERWAIRSEQWRRGRR